MNVTIEMVSYSNSSDRKVLQSCLKTWFSDPKELHFTDPRIPYPFQFKTWCSLSYENNDVRTFIAKDGKWIVGYISLSVNHEKSQGHIFHLFVDSKHRRQGLAKMLMDHAISVAGGERLSTVTLHVVQKNTRAFNIYGNAGFTEVGITSGGSRKMRKEIG